MKKVLTLAGFLGFAALQMPAQNGIGSDAGMANILWPLDSLLTHYNYPAVDASNFDTLALNKYHFKPGEVPQYEDAVFEERIRNMGSAIPFEYNKDVRAFIDLYTIRRRGQVERMLGLQYLYFPMIEQELDKEGIPMEIKYLPIVESAFNPAAVSRCGATGLWQFMLPTGKLYHLDVNSFVDERRDPFKSTQAAIKYLKNMYVIYKDWLLCIAAYNCGPGNVNRAIARSGGKMTFWEIQEYLPYETRSYVPAFIAAAYVFNYPAEHNIYPRKIDFSFEQDTVLIIRQQITLQQIAHVTGSDFYTLSDLNPELKTHTVPYQADGYPLRVPAKTAMIFAVYRDSVYKQMAALTCDSARACYSTNKESVVTLRDYSAGRPTAPASPVNPGGQTGVATGNGILVNYTVRYGDIVGQIASNYWVTANQIATWNGLSNYRIWPGQKLKIYVPEKRATEMGIKTAGTEAGSQQAAATPGTSPQQPANGEKVMYKVQPGDTLWDICQKYQGLTIEKLKSLNGMGASSALQVGQMLVVN